MSPRRITRRSQSGSAFVLALFTMVVMVLVVTSFSLRMDSHVRGEAARLERRNAEFAIQAGIARAMAALTAADTNALKTSDEWYTIGETGETNFIVGDAQVRMQIIDTTRLVNINSATEEQLRKMNLTEEQVAALQDWREEQLQPRAQGAKDEFYNALPTPYNTKLRRLESVNELFLIRGFTPFMVLNPAADTTSFLTTGNAEDQPALAELLTTDSQSPNNQADGTARINLNQAENAQLVQAGLSNQAAQAIVQRRNQGQFTSMNEVFDAAGINVQDAEAILNIGTVTGENFQLGKININTAPEAVLRTIPELTEDQIQSILGQQGTFESLGELAQIPGVTTNALGDFADFFTIACQTFLVRLEGKKGNATSYSEVLIVVTEGQPKILKIGKPLQRNPLAAWGWSTEAATDTTLLEPAN